MAMTAGSVSVNPSTAAVTKSGYAGARYDVKYARFIATLAALGQSEPADIPMRVAFRTALADAANDDAAIITYIQANAETSSDSETIL